MKYPKKQKIIIYRKEIFIFFIYVFVINLFCSCYDNSFSHLQKGIDKFNKGDKQGAILEYNKAISLDPENALAYRKRGYVKFNISNYVGAIEDYNEAINLDPKDYISYYYRAECNEHLNNWNEALEDYNKTISIDPSDPQCWSYFNRGKIKFFELKDYQGALDDFNKAKCTMPGYFELYRGIAKYNLKDKIGACQDLKNSIGKIQVIDSMANKLIKNWCNQ